jgi:hypothetical protein
MGRADDLQERLEQLEQGRSLEECLSGLTADEADLLKLAAGLRQVEYPEQDRDSVIAQRAAVLRSAIKEREGKDKVSPQARETSGRSLPRWLAPATMLAGAGVLICVLVAAIAAGVVWWSGREPRLAQVPPSDVVPEEAGQPQGPYDVFLPLASQETPLTPQTSRLKELRGVVELQTEDGTWTAVATPQIVAAGQRIRTGALSGARLVLYDGSQVALGPDTELSLDTLDARTKGGPRVVVLGQWLGEAVHDVIPATAAGSRYEVHTPSAVGTAQGTVFQVLITPDRFTHFSVDEGAVAVTGAEVTVVVNTGQLTTVPEDEAPADPAFRITGEGQVSQIGDVWIIAGQPFQTHDATVIVGDPQVGDWVFVRGHLLPDDTRVADWITLLRRSPANRFSLAGEVEAIADDAWTVAGQTVAVNDETDVDDDIVVGDLVRVAGVILPEGELQAERIVRLEDVPGLPFDFEGVVQAVADTTWRISGIAVTVDDETDIATGLDVGDLVRVRGWILDDGAWLASIIERVDDEEPTFEFTGAIESIDPWVVAGIPFETHEWTEIEPGLAVGDLVRVKGRILEDGVWVAFEIEQLDDEAALRIVLVGPVSSIDPWIVSGIPLAVDQDTVIEGEIVVGMLVRVEIIILPDGTWRVVEIRPFQGFGGGLGCLTFTGVVVDVDGDQLQLVGWPPLTLGDDVQLAGELEPNSIVLFQICFADDMTLRVVYIIVIYTPEPVVVPSQPPLAEPPGGEGNKVTVCHKPDGKNPHTITIARSALPAHLAHGDILGPCPDGK